jgi:hypothetical protein
MWTGCLLAACSELSFGTGVQRISDGVSTYNMHITTSMFIHDLLGTAKNYPVSSDPWWSYVGPPLMPRMQIFEQSPNDTIKVFLIVRLPNLKPGIPS